MLFSQLPQLLSSCPPPLIHVHDPHNQLLYNPTFEQIRAAQRAFVLIDCTECISQRVLFARVVNGLANWTPSWSDAGECWGGTELDIWDLSFDTFSKALKALWQSILDSSSDDESSNGESDGLIIVLQNSERLKETLPGLFIPFTRLSELTGAPVCVIIVSQCSWLSLRPPLGTSPTPLFCAIPPLGSAQICQYLVSLFPTKRPRSPVRPYNPRLRPLYEQFIQAMYAACSSTTNDPNQLAYIAAARWLGFVTPLLNDWKVTEATQQELNTTLRAGGSEDELYPVPSTADTLRLLHTFKPTFIPALHTLLPRLMTAQIWSEANMPADTVRLSQPLTLSHHSIATSKSTVASSVEQAETLLKGLTTRTRVLLLASYAASFNPARTDARLFERTAEGVAAKARKKKRSGGGGASPKKTPVKPSTAAKLSRGLTGPGAFSLERLLAIYESLLIEHIGDELDALDDEQRDAALKEWPKEVGRVQLVGMVSQLVQTQLLQRTSASIANEVFDGSTQLKSNVSYDLAARIAKGLKIDLGDILWDVDRV